MKCTYPSDMSETGLLELLHTKKGYAAPAAPTAITIFLCKKVVRCSCTQQADRLGMINLSLEEYTQYPLARPCAKIPL